MEELEDLFLQKKPARILVGIYRGDDSKYASVLSKEADCTYSHTVKILDKFEGQGLVEFSKEGRKKLIDLTERGAELAERLDGFMKAMESAN
ncbi:MAG: MarR family winged helix-turn-helix transcriptional regulator [Candidatus Nanohaloarchaea archaeon]|nr:MarR family winged helix-turn-helix transcriptional regulator [Candidatus Nanohaloarchaea archaeon]